MAMVENQVPPSLLDRLVDNDPSVLTESFHAGQISARRMREIIRRDLGWLLATVRMEEFVDIDGYENVSNSVLNYGVRDLSGVPEQNINPLEVQEAIRKAICNFEPRFARSSVNVRLLDAADDDQRGQAKIRITGQLQIPGMEGSIQLEAKINFETGDIKLVEA